MIGSNRGPDWQTKKVRMMERLNGKEEFLVDSMYELEGQLPTLSDMESEFKKRHKKPDA